MTTYTVYVGTDTLGVIKFVGVTVQRPSHKFAHFRRIGKNLLFAVVASYTEEKPALDERNRLMIKHHLRAMGQPMKFPSLGIKNLCVSCLRREVVDGVICEVCKTIK